MKLSDIFYLFPEKLDCVRFFSKITNAGMSICPYCNSPRNTLMRLEARYHCNNCNTSFSVTVGTFLHNSKVPLQNWIYLMYLFASKRIDVSFRRLSLEVGVSKDTIRKMFDTLLQQDALLLEEVRYQVNSISCTKKE